MFARAKAKTIARAKAVARPATLVAKAREAARPTEVNHLKHSDEKGRSFRTLALVFGTEERPFTFLEGFNR